MPAATPMKRIFCSLLEMLISLFYPGNIFFVIFWFPIVVPLCVNLIASTIELAVEISSLNQENVSAILNSKFLLIIFKNSHLAFISTDLWALTTTLMYSAKAKLDGLKAWVYGCAGIIALFLHFLFYSVTILVSKSHNDLWISVVLFLSGCITVFWLRFVIYQNIERVMDLEELRAAKRPIQ